MSKLQKTKSSIQNKFVDKTQKLDIIIQTCPMSLISIGGLCRMAETDINVVLELVLRLTTSQVDNFVDKIQMLAFKTCT